MALCASEGHRILVSSQEPEAREEHREQLRNRWQACKAPELQDNGLLLVTNSLTCNTSLDLGDVSCVVEPPQCRRGIVDEIGSQYMGFGGIERLNKAENRRVRQRYIFDERIAVKGM